MSILDDLQLSNKIALVTGCRRGIGKAMAVGLAEAGADIIGVSRNLELNGSQVEEEVKALNKNFHSYTCDFSNREALYTFINQVNVDFPVIDILVNNAGVHDFDNFLSSNAEKILKKMVDTHLYGSFYCTQAVIKEMKKNKRGDIIFITSLAEKQFMQEEWAYTSAKTAVSTMAQCIATVSYTHLTLPTSDLV